MIIIAYVSLKIYESHHFCLSFALIFWGLILIQNYGRCVNQNACKNLHWLLQIQTIKTRASSMPGPEWCCVPVTIKGRHIALLRIRPLMITYWVQCFAGVNLCSSTDFIGSWGSVLLYYFSCHFSRN